MSGNPPETSTRLLRPGNNFMPLITSPAVESAESERKPLVMPSAEASTSALRFESSPLKPELSLPPSSVGKAGFVLMPATGSRLWKAE